MVNGYSYIARTRVIIIVIVMVVTIYYNNQKNSSSACIVYSVCYIANVVVVNYIQLERIAAYLLQAHQVQHNLHSTCSSFIMLVQHLNSHGITK